MNIIKTGTNKTKHSMSELEMDLKKDEQDSKQVENEQLSKEERDTLTKIENDFSDARGTRESSTSDDELNISSEWSIEEEWEDDYRMFKGGGLQWATKFAYRSRRNRRRRPGSENNFIFNALTIQHANITAQTPTVSIEGIQTDDVDTAQKLTDASRFNDNRNDFSKKWKKLVMDFISSGPTIAMVTWDNDWIGGRGPERWVGDVRVDRIDKWDMFFDPSITDLERNLQDCSYIIRRPRKKLKYIRDRWNKGRLVSEQANEDELINEGANHRQAYVIEYWHRGFPMYVPEDRKLELEQKAEQLEAEGNIYKAKDYRDSAKGDLEGVHVAYVSDGVLLEYRPYEYEHGEYPFVFTTRYHDDKCQWGFGEIRNIKIPQVMHNKADEIEIEAMSREGLGGKLYQTKSITPKQMNNILDNYGKGGAWFEVENVNLIKDREGVRVPASVTNYKEHKQRMIETVSNNTPIQQGVSPGSNVPFATIQELGARSDVRMKQINNKLQDFLKRVNQLRIELFAQFYTEERYYRIAGSNGEPIEGTIQQKDIQKEWVRDQRVEMQVNPLTGIPEPVMIEDIETYVPEFDVKVTVMSEKPTDRNYYTSTAMQLHQMGIISAEDLLNTLEDGKLPPTDDLIDRYHASQPIQRLLSELGESEDEVKQAVIETMLQAGTEVMQQVQLQEQATQQNFS